ncbi:MAG TPA: PIG-L family deacetylase [Candidatus Dormibacteraeota bacterium]|nr:PIG-L family deacetylase [Candidatus Dormibacteraeota bacterium]
MPTLMAVHAHPDDEAIQTGGVLAMYPHRGVHTVLVTCTNGEMGDSPDGLKPESDAHDTVATSELRLRELREAVKALGVNDLELLGYRDSGMMGWPQNKEPEAFWNVPVEEAVDRVAALMEQHRPEVVITYDDRGLYGHPDHIQAHRATIGAAEKTRIPQKIYEIAFPKSLMDVFAEFQRQQGEEPPAPEDNENAIGTPDELITTHVDVSSVYDQKRAAALAHQSQMANFDFLKIDEDMLRAWFSVEHYVRRFDRTGAPVPEDDLFAGVS